MPDMYVGGLFLSTNGGQSWAAVDAEPTYVTALAIDPSTPDTLYAGIGALVGPLASPKHDSGRT
jgi:hypothetical protein